MSTLNLALQNVSLARSKMVDELEQLMSSLNTLTDVRRAIDKRPELGEGLSDSLSPVMVLLSQRFGAMKLYGRSVKLGVPATEAEISEQFLHSHFIEPSLERERLTQDVLKSASGLQSFMKNHCHSSHYAYQLKKCTSQDCYYCKEHPISFLQKHLVSYLFFLYRCSMLRRNTMNNLKSCMENFQMNEVVYLMFLCPLKKPRRRTRAVEGLL